MTTTYFLVRPDGSVENYDFPLECAPDLPPDYRVVANVLPTLDSDTQTARMVLPIPAGAVVVPYEIDTLSAQDLLQRKRERMRVSPRQIRQALNRQGLREKVEAALSGLDADAKDWWEFASTFERLHPLVASVGAALSVSDEDLDALFQLAQSL
jgi:hypothetical protein